MKTGCGDKILRVSVAGLTQARPAKGRVRESSFNMTRWGGGGGGRAEG